MVDSSLSFTIASYNILADAYIHRARYPRTPRMVLSPAWRRRALVQRVCALETDILCLQEVEARALGALGARLGMLGYGVQYGQKSGAKPDGCALFFRQQTFTLMDSRILAYGDGGGAADSGDIALIARLRSARAVVGVVNTHLTWDPPDTPLGSQRGFRQARQLILEYKKMADLAEAWILAGDFNAIPDSSIVALIEAANFDYAHRGRTGFFTCNVNGQAKIIDYLFHSSALRAEPQAIISVDDRSVLPSAEEPSDHVPIVARFSWSA